MTIPLDAEQDMIAYYRARAPFMQYDSLPENVASILDSYAAYLTDKLSGRRVLEIACGTGFWTQRLATHADTVMAIDAAPEMLDLAKSRKYGRANVAFVVDDAYTLSAVSETFDGGFHFQWISHVPHARLTAFWSAFHARLRPGAAVVFGDNKDRGTEPDSDGNLYQGRILPDGSRHRVIKNWLTEEQLRDLLQPQVRGLEFKSFEKDWFACYTLR